MQLAKSEGIKNAKELAVFLGYNASEKLSRLSRNPDAKPSVDIIEDITNKFENLNVRWLLTGKGEMLINNKNYDDTPAPTTHFGEHNDGYVTTTPAPSPAIGITKVDPLMTQKVTPLKVLSPQIISTDKVGKENILHVSVKAAAGYLNGYGDRSFTETLPSFSLPGLNNYSYRSFEVDGESMVPTLENKEMVIGQWVEGVEYIREDRVHILITKNDGIVIKRLLNRVNQYGYVICKSDAFDNRNQYDNIHVHAEDILEIWYAVWHGSFNFKSPGEMYKRMNNLEADLYEVMRTLKANKLLK